MRRGLISLSTMIFGLCGVLVYQNCSQPVETGSFSSFQSFAIDSKLDTIAYMSCSGMTSADPSAYFTFRAGAYANGGMRLSQEFYDNTANMSTNRAVSHLISSSHNGPVQMQLSIRRNTDLVIFAKENPAAVGSDFALMMPPITNEQLATSLVNANEGGNGAARIRNVAGSFNSINRMEGDVRFYDSPTLENSVREEMRKGAFLALTYLDVNKENPQNFPLSPGDFEESPDQSAFNFAFGTGYRMTFQQGNPAEGHPARTIGAVDEVDLLSKSSTGVSWSCPQSMRFKVVRPEDVGILDENNNLLVQCDRVLDPNVLTAEEAVVRRVLHTEDWWIDMQNRCIIPKPGKVGFCYGQDLDIEYNNLPCGANGKACTHFVSVCTANL